MDNRPIGVFDSGMGGLTVLRELKKVLPAESMIYFGDCGRIPYGTKSRETVIKYTFQNIRFLLSQDVKMVVIACNTASAFGYAEARKAFDIPIVEVVTPGAACAVRKTKNNKVGIIGTEGTINSGAYQKAIHDINPGIHIYSRSCPLFVQLVEDGWWDNDVTRLVASKYLKDLKEANIDTLVLGCTHYPHLAGVIRDEMGENVQLVSSGYETALVVKKKIEENDIKRDEKLAPFYRYYTSDSVEKFRSLGSIYMGEPIEWVEKVDIEKY